MEKFTNDGKVNEMKLWNLNHISRVFDKVTIPGLSHARQRQEDSVFRRRAWILLFFVGIGLTILQVQRVFTDYLDYFVNTKVLVSDTSFLPFPAITVCPLTKVVCKNVFTTVQNCSQHRDCAKLDHFCDIWFHSGCVLAMEKLNNSSRKFQEFCPRNERNDACIFGTNFKFNYSTLHEMAKAINEKRMDGLLFYLSESEKLSLGPDWNDISLSCDIKHNQQDCNNFFSARSFFSPYHGTCFTLNYQDSVGPVRNGVEAGLHLELILPQNNVLFRQGQDREGMRVALHNPKENPLLIEKGIDLSPGYSYRLGMEVSEMQRQPSPYESKCVQGWTDTTIDPDVTNGQVYSQVGCGRLCGNFCVMERCDCIHPNLDDVNLLEYQRSNNLHPQEYCINRTCSNKALKTYDRSTCNCNMKCQESVFHVSVSSMRWPSYNSWIFKALRYNLTFNGETITEDVWHLEEKKLKEMLRQVRENILRLDMFYGSTKKLIIHEEPVFPNLYSLFTNLGGALSIWMGASFIMIIEFFDLTCEILLGILCFK